MKKFTAKNGHLAYSADFEEISKLGGLAICDSCNEYATEGFLVPVLNYYMCPKCFARWESTADYFSEDSRYESQTAQYFERVISNDTN